MGRLDQTTVQSVRRLRIRHKLSLYFLYVSDSLRENGVWLDARFIIITIKVSCSGTRVWRLYCAMSLIHSMATRLGTTLDDVYKNGDLWWLRPEQSRDIAGAVHVGEDDFDVGVGGQDIMFGCASDETEDVMPLTHSMATRLGTKWTDVRKNGDRWRSCPTVEQGIVTPEVFVDVAPCRVPPRWGSEAWRTVERMASTRSRVSVTCLPDGWSV